MKELAGRKAKKSQKYQTAIRENGIEVTGEEVSLVWKDAFEKLGKEEEVKGLFDEKFKEAVTKEVEETEERCNQRGEGRLNRRIEFAEVEKMVKSMSNGKAAGVDKIVHEIIKYGGESVRSNMAPDQNVLRDGKDPGRVDERNHFPDI